MSKLKVVIIGLGNMGFKYIENLTISNLIKYSTHVQVVNDHPLLELHGAVDKCSSTVKKFIKRFPTENVGTDINDLKNLELVDILVIATPPLYRAEFLDYFPRLKALIVEKPLGSNLEDSRNFLNICQLKKIITQVNFNRRTDKLMQSFANGNLSREIGSIQCGFGVYGHGLLNYASHTIDLVRMLLGEVTKVQALPCDSYGRIGPINDDINISFVLYVDKIPIAISPINFSEYREGSLDLWGTKGRIQILQEGLKYHVTKTSKCRSASNMNELNSDQINIFNTGYDESMYYLYDEVVKKINNSSLRTSSDIFSAFQNELIIDSIKNSFYNNSKIITINKHK